MASFYNYLVLERLLGGKKKERKEGRCIDALDSFNHLFDRFINQGLKGITFINKCMYKFIIYTFGILKIRKLCENLLKLLIWL